LVALTKYVAAEKALDLANESKDQAAIDAARIEVMQTARNAATVLHHLQDVVMYDTAPRFVDLEDVRKALRAVCVFGRGPTAIDDTDLLRDAADAFKHFVMTRPSSTVRLFLKALMSIAARCSPNARASCRRSSAAVSRS
jgi:hypothetical protein